MHQLLVAGLWVFQIVTTQALNFGEALSQHGSTLKLYNILERLQLIDEFNAARNVTFLAMTDTAVDNTIGCGFDLASLDPEVARAALRYHLLDGSLRSQDFAPTTEARPVIPHSVLRPPTFTNVTNGPVVKLWVSEEDKAIHVESGTLKRSNVVEYDIEYDNGIIHTIDSNLMLPHSLTETTNTGPHKGFRGLMERSEMTELVESLGDVTILIPSHDAVKKKFSEDTLQSLGVEQLAQIVGNHIIPNHVLYHDGLVAGQASVYKTLSGMPIWLGRAKKGFAFLNSHVEILQEDILIYGGVAHIIDDVLLGPPSRIMRFRILFIQIGHMCKAKATDLMQATTELAKTVDWWTIMKGVAFTAAAVALLVVAFVRLLGWTSRVSRQSANLSPSNGSMEKTLVRMGILVESDLHGYSRVPDGDEESGAARGN